ncbi:MAG: 30S ribosomal protein S7 [Gammaproteobacteria bacterium]
MSRRRVAEKRKIQPDPIYKDQVVTKFINCVMSKGEKSIAEKIVYGALKIIKEKIKAAEPLLVFKKALEHASPVVEIKARRVGGATFQVPIEVNSSRALALAMRWIISYSRKRGEKGMVKRLAGELIDASDENSSTGGSKGKGGAIGKREDTHRMAAANKAFAHFSKY